MSRFPVRPKGDPVYSYRHAMRSRYSETDQMGIVYYGRYMEYFEVARTEMIRSLGFPYARLEDRGIFLPVVSAQVRYHGSLTYDEPFEVEVSVFERPTVRLQTWYRVFRTVPREADGGGVDGRVEQGASAEPALGASPVTSGFVELCFMDADSRRPVPAPDFFLEALRGALGNSAGDAG